MSAACTACAAYRARFGPLVACPAHCPLCLHWSAQLLALPCEVHQVVSLFDPDVRAGRLPS